MAIAARREHSTEAPQLDLTHGLLICMMGIDGAGKSTQALRLVARLKAGGYRARYVWAGRQSSLTRPLVRLGKARMHAPARPTTASVENNQSYRAYMHSTQRLFKRRLARAAWQRLTLAEHVMQIWQRVSMPLLRGEIVVCDRYLYDTLVSQAVLFGDAPEAFVLDAHRFALALVPRPALGFWLDLPPDVALGRKSDIYDRAHLEARRPFYAQLAGTLALHRLDATRDTDALAHTIWLHTLGRLSARRAVAIRS